MVNFIEQINVVVRFFGFSHVAQYTKYFCFLKLGIRTSREAGFSTLFLIIKILDMKSFLMLGKGDFP